VTNVARPLRGLVPVLAALAAVTGAALPAAAAAPVTAQSVARADEWWLTALGVPAALRAAPTAGKGVTVAVLSTGVDAIHPDLRGSVTIGPDFSKTGRAQGSPYWGFEGTAVASLIAGHGHGPGGTEGITGVAPDARILSLPVTLEYDDPLTSDAAIAQSLPNAIAAGIEWAVGHGATVIALPLDPGTLGSAPSGSAAAGGSAAERAAVSFALAHDVLLVAPAGDNGAEGNAINYPAAYPGVIAVGASTRDGTLSPFSNTGSDVALAAPGAGITPDPPASGGMTADPAAGLIAAAPDGGYEPLASSDMSAALTTGVAALIRSRYPGLTVPEVTQALERGVTAPPGSSGSGPAGAGWGHGELDAAAALSSAAAIAAAHPSPAPSTATATAPAPRPAGVQATHRVTASLADPGHLLRSLVVDLAVAAAALIACLVVAIAVTGRRRRARTGSRPPGHARHAKGQSGPPTAPIPARVVIWPSTPTTPPGGNSGSAWLGATSAAGDPSPGTGVLARPGASHRRPLPAGNPPWQPATPPRDPASPPAMLPAQTVAERPGPPLAPWEESPAEFAVAQHTEDFAAWSISNTGPMYVWNPATATGPIIAVSDDDDSWT
jgi:subtilisin family serine protease